MALESSTDARHMRTMSSFRYLPPGCSVDAALTTIYEQFTGVFIWKLYSSKCCFSVRNGVEVRKCAVDLPINDASRLVQIFNQQPKKHWNDHAKF
jgi:hypothetical protein